MDKYSVRQTWKDFSWSFFQWKVKIYLFFTAFSSMALSWLCLLAGQHLNPTKRQVFYNHFLIILSWFFMNHAEKKEWNFFNLFLNFWIYWSLLINFDFFFLYLGICRAILYTWATSLRVEVPHPHIYNVNNLYHLLEMQNMLGWFDWCQLPK